MSTEAHHNLKGMMLAAAGFSFYAIGDVFMKYAGEYYPPEQIALSINCFFLPMLLIASRHVGGLSATLKTKHLKLHLFRAGLGMVVFFMMVNGFGKLGMATSYTLIFAGPFIAAILSIHFLGQKIGMHRWGSIIAGFIGVLVVLRPGMVPLEPAALGILLAAVCFAGSTIIIRKIGADEPLLAFSLYGCIASFAVFGTMLAIKGNFVMPPPEHLWWFLGTASFHIFAGFWTSRAFTIGDNAVIAPFQYTQLIWGVAAGYLLFDDAIDVWTGLGGLIIVSSGLYMIHRERVRRKEMTKGVVSHGGSLMHLDTDQLEERDAA